MQSSSTLAITLDTNVIDARGLDEVEQATRGLDIDIKRTTVSDREQSGDPSDSSALVETAVWEESHWDQMQWGGPLPETLVIGESQIGLAVIGSTGDLLEELLKIISNGSFPVPGARDDLSNGERRQLRDAMILHTHAREQRDIFVSNDQRAYGRPGSDLRHQIEELCNTKVMTTAEFTAHCENLKRARQD